MKMYLIPPLRHDELFESWLDKIYQYNDSLIYPSIKINDISKLKAKDILNICIYMKDYLQFDFIDIIKKNTLLPYITPFSDSSKLIWRYTKMHYLRYLDNAKECHKSYFRLENPKMCVHCINEEINTFGGAYIHRSHQIPGNYFCIKHNSKLKVANDFYYSTSDYSRLDLSDTLGPEEEYTDKLKLLSQDIYDVSNGLLNGFTIDYIKMVIWIIMYEKGYIDNMIIKPEFFSMFYEYHNYFYLKQLNYSLFSIREDIFNFKTLILKPGFGSYSPVQIILIIRMLFDGGLREFVDYSRRHSTFEKLRKLMKLLNSKVYMDINFNPYVMTVEENLYDYLLKTDGK